MTLAGRFLNRYNTANFTQFSYYALCGSSSDRVDLDANEAPSRHIVMPATLVPPRSPNVTAALAWPFSRQLPSPAGAYINSVGFCIKIAFRAFSCNPCCFNQSVTAVSSSTLRPKINLQRDTMFSTAAELMPRLMRYVICREKRKNERKGVSQ